MDDAADRGDPPAAPGPGAGGASGGVSGGVPSGDDTTLVRDTVAPSLRPHPLGALGSALSEAHCSLAFYVRRTDLPSLPGACCF